MRRYIKIEGKGWYFSKSDDELEGPFSSRTKAKAAFAEWWPKAARRTIVVSV